MRYYSLNLLKSDIMFECECGFYIDIEDLDYTDLDFEIVCDKCKRKYRITVTELERLK